MSQRQSIRGMHDILPSETPLWQWLESQVEAVLKQYQFEEIRVPIVEHTEVFTKAIGQTTDVVEKEMYTFEDRSGDSLTLRPEGTAGVVRSVIQHGLLHPPGQKVWYHGPMFRYERPQRGRQRQFHQYGVEVFGLAEPVVDVELMAMIERLWQRLGLSSAVSLEVNSLGDPDDRARYRQHLVDYLTPYAADLDEDSKRRLQTNPLRIFDSKIETTQAIMSEAPRFGDFMGDAARAHFEQVQALLNDLGISFRVNSGLVRGLDYYCRTVFEWVTDQLGAQGTVCAGGRYDGLTAMAGGKDVPGIGLAMGEERLLELIKAKNEPLPVASGVYWLGQVPVGELLAEAEALRLACPHLTVGSDLVGGSLKSQFKRADRSGARVALIYGEAERSQGIVQVKDLRSDSTQQSVSKPNLAQYLSSLFSTQS